MTPTRKHLFSLLGVNPSGGFYIDSDDGQPNPLHVYCIEHAHSIAERWGKARGTVAFVCGCWGGSDHVERCAITTCGVDLDVGGLTDHGVDSALALTEEDPFACSSTPAELYFSALAMDRNDPRWAMWDHQVLATIEYEKREAAR